MSLGNINWISQNCWSIKPASSEILACSFSYKIMFFSVCHSNQDEEEDKAIVDGGAVSWMGRERKPLSRADKKNCRVTGHNNNKNWSNKMKLIYKVSHGQHLSHVRERGRGKAEGSGSGGRKRKGDPENAKLLAFCCVGLIWYTCLKRGLSGS